MRCNAVEVETEYIWGGVAIGQERVEKTTKEAQ